MDTHSALTDFAPGFASLRLAQRDGGSGLDIDEVLHRLVGLASIDPGLTQAWRSHILFVESVLAGDEAGRARWLGRIAAGDVFAGGWTEAAPTVDIGTFTTALTRTPDGYLLTGTKYYSTGSLYADWLQVSARQDDGSTALATVRADAVGVTISDDWTGFGQRSSASGTTRFDSVLVDPADVIERPAGSPASVALAQLVLLAVAVGIGDGIVATARDTVRAGDRSQTGNDPLHSARLGEILALQFGARSAFGAAAHRLKLAQNPADERLGADLQHEALLASYQAQLVVLPGVLSAAAVAAHLATELDPSQTAVVHEHWRNARTIASHNPLEFRKRILGDAEAWGIDPGSTRQNRTRSRSAS